MKLKFGVYTSGYVVLSFIEIGTVKRGIDSMGNKKKKMRLRIEQNIGEMLLFRAKIESKIRKNKKGKDRSLK